MTKFYPPMDLNIQISFGYARYLDVHLMNVTRFNASESYSLYSTLGWKSQNSFLLVPSSSNKHPNYKEMAVSSNLNRIYKRCSLEVDKQHHISFLLNIMRNRKQNMVNVSIKVKKFFKKQRQPLSEKKATMFDKSRRCTRVLFDESTRSFFYVKKLIDKYAQRLSLIHI